MKKSIALPEGVVLNKKKKKHFSVLMLILGILLFIYTISLFIPLAWSLMTSVKTDLEMSNPFGFPEVPQFVNYLDAFGKFKVQVMDAGGTRFITFLEMGWYSITYAVGSSFIQTFIMFVMAYLSARFNFKFTKLFYAIVIFTMIFPIIGAGASGLYVAEALGLMNSIIGMYIMKAYFLGVYYLVLHAQLQALPKDYTEAAYMDGAGNLMIMFRIIFPLVINTFFTMVLLHFIGYWNDYGTPLLYMPLKPTLAYGLYLFSMSTDNLIADTPHCLAACMILTVPTMALFLIFHNRLLGNLSMGGLKE